MELPLALFVFIAINLHCTCNSSESISSCPFGFVEMEFESSTPSESIYCGKQMGRTTFDEMNKRCVRNFIPSESSSIYPFDPDLLYWVYLKRAYENGPFINQNIQDSSFGLIEDFEETEPIDGSAMCAVANFSSSEIHAVNCDEKYNSICVVDATFLRGDVIVDQFCTFDEIPFKTPIMTCLKTFENISTTSLAAKTLCEKDKGHLVQGGCIYLSTYGFQSTRKEYPIGIKSTNGIPHWLLPEYNRYSELPDGDWEGVENFSSVSFKNEKFTVKEPEYIYSFVTCEYDIKTSTSEMVLSIHTELHFTNGSGYKKKLILKLTGHSKRIEESDIACFTDSETYHPTAVVFSKTKDGEFLLYGAKSYGYYWCIAIKQGYFKPESNKVFFSPDLTLPKKSTAYWLYFPTHNTKQDIKAYIETQFFPPVYKRIYKNNTVLIHSTTYRPSSVNKTILLKRDIQQCNALNKVDKAHAGDSAVDVSSPVKFHMCWEDINDVKFSEEDLEYNPTTGNYETTSYTIDYSTPDTTDYSGDYSTDESPTEDYFPISSTPTYNEQIDRALDTIQEAMLDSTVNIEKFENVVKEVNSVLLLKDVNITQTLAKNFDDLLNAVEISADQRNITIIQSNIAILVAKRGGPSPVVGIKVESIGNGSINDHTLHELTKVDMQDPGIYETRNDIVVKLPSNLCQGVSEKVAFALFKDDTAFPKRNDNVWEVNSRVLSISLDNKTCFKKTDFVDIHFRPYDSQQSNKKKACAYWDFDHSNWSTNGCTLLPPEKLRTLDICRCHHLTHFAQIIRYADIESEAEHKTILSGITYFSCGLSLIGIIVICMTGMISQTWRAEFSNQVWMNLSLSIGMLIISFLTISILDFSSIDSLICIGTGALLHFAVLSSFSWMFLTAFMSYKKIKRVFVDDSPCKLLRVGVVGWILPVIPIAILLSLDSDSYLLHLKQGNTEMDFCYPSGLGYWLTVFLPIAVVVFANTILFLLIMCKIFERTNIQSHGGSQKMARKVSTCFLMFFLYGLTWMFGLFSNNIYVAYIFCVTATAQGFVLFVFFIIVNRNTRNIWRRCLGVKTTTYMPTNTSNAEKTKCESSYEKQEFVKLKNYHSSAFD